MVCMYVALFSHCHLHEALCWLQYAANARKHACYVNTGYVTLSHWLCHTVTLAMSHCHWLRHTIILATSHYHSGYVTLSHGLCHTVTLAISHCYWLYVTLSLWLRHTITLGTSHCHSGYVTLSLWLRHTVILATSHWVYKHNVSHMHIHTDSPAARTSLKCGDELLAVNGQSLRDATHSEATNILHKVSKQS